MAIITDLIAKLKLDSAQFKAELLTSTENINTFSNKAKLGLLAVAGILTGAVIGGLHELKSTIAESTEKMTALVHSSERLGVGVEALQRLQFASNLAGVSVDQLNTLLKFMEKNLGNIGTGVAGKKLGTYFDEMGISAKALLALPIEEQFNANIKWMLRETIYEHGGQLGFGGIANQDERAAASMAVFGRGGIVALGLVQHGVSAAEKQFDSLGIAVSGKGAESIEQYGEKVKVLDAVWEGFKNQLTAAVVFSFQIRYA